jgi:hypothetical protein
MANEQWIGPRIVCTGCEKDVPIKMRGGCFLCDKCYAALVAAGLISAKAHHAAD